MVRDPRALMRTIDLRIALEAAGVTLTIEGRELVVNEPLGGLTPELRAELKRHQGALSTLVSLYPCGRAEGRQCGREPFAGVCHPCPASKLFDRDPHRRRPNNA